MGLTRREQEIFERIAVDFSADDPRLAHRLTETTSTAKAWRRRRAGAAVAFVVGVAMLTGAIFVPRDITGGVFIVAISGYLVMFGAAMRWLTAPRSRVAPSKGCDRDRPMEDAG